MNAVDLENLASVLDKNRTFERPQHQSTGFSLQANATASASAPSPAAAAHNAVTASTAAPYAQANPSGLAMPPTVVDHQLRLPAPSHGKAAERKKQLSKPSVPRGDEIWTQAELRERFAQQRRAGPAPVAAAARAAAAAAQRPGGLWRPTVADASTYVEPVYTVLYQQNISAEDVYLGVDFTRDASSAASDGVTVRVELPGVAAVGEIATEVDPYELRVSVAGRYYVAAALPRKVQRAAADATWDSQKSLLTVRLRADHGEGEVKIVA